MNFYDIKERIQWTPFDGQGDSKVTYVFVAPNPRERLNGKSDILYIGRTSSPIKDRHKAQTSTRPTPKSTQSTNVRMTHVLKRLNDMGIEHAIYFCPIECWKLPKGEVDSFSCLLELWSKRAHVRHRKAGALEYPTLETYLLVKYANEHLELPPLNNRF